MRAEFGLVRSCWKGLLRAAVSTTAVLVGAGLVHPAFAEVGTGGGAATPIGGMAISPPAVQCPTGSEAVAGAEGAIALGCGALSNGPFAVTLGNNSQALFDGAVALGTSTFALEKLSLAVGDGAIAYGASSAAVGDRAAAIQTNGVAIGSQAVSYGLGAVSVGEYSAALGEGDVYVGGAAGMGGDASNYRNSGLGERAGSNVRGYDNTAIGATSGNNVAGRSNFAGGSFAGSDVVGDGNIAIGGADSVCTRGVDRGGYQGDGSGGDNMIAQGVDRPLLDCEPTLSAAGSQVSGSRNLALGAHAGVGVSANDTVSIGSSSLARADASVAIGKGAIAANTGDVALGAGSKSTAAVATASGSINGVVYNYAGAAPTSTVSVGAPNAERTITNLAAGHISATSTDAVNGSQLFATNQALSEAIKELGGAATGAVTVDNAAGGAAATASGLNAAAVGYGAIASGAGAVAIGGNGAASAPNSVALGANSIANEADTVSVGAHNAERRVTNVANGIAQTDAASVGQLNTAMSAATASANGYTDFHVNALNVTLNQAVRRADAGTAGAMAVAGVPQAITPGQGLVGLGVGTWNGQSAIAFGVSKASDNGRVIFKAGAAYNSQGRGGGNAGIGWQF